MNTNTIEDDYFGLLRWDSKDYEWCGTITLLSHGVVGVELPPEYVDSKEVHKHIQGIMKIIERDELGFRERAANDLFTRGGFVLFLNKNQAFDHTQFVKEMHLALISFTPDVPNNTLTLCYEFGEDGMEHGISIALTWDGIYRYTRVE